MRTYPESEDDLKHAANLKAEPWQMDLLRLNPSCVYWGNFEDYMGNDKGGWDSRVNLSSWDEHWGLDELNECVNFYFEVSRKGHDCPDCEGQNLNKATLKLWNDWYDLKDFGRRWCDKITDVEVDALMKKGRLRDLVGQNCYFDEDTDRWMGWVNKEMVEIEKPKYPSAKEVNDWSPKGLGHDGINHWICVKARAHHLGVFGNCENPECVEGTVYDEPKGKVALQMWFLHPRKGCSRGVYIEEIKQHEVQDVLKYLKSAADRNTERFSKIYDALGV